MATATTRALLVLPDPSESYAVPIVNANMTALDGHLGFAPFTAATRPASAFSGRSIRETDTEKLYYSRGTVPISASWVQILTANADAGLNASAALTFGGDSTINRLGANSLRTLGAWRVEGNETVIGTTTASGAVTMNAGLTVGGNVLVNGTATACGSLVGWGGAWTAYTPTWTNVTLGTGATQAARWFQVGKIVYVQARLTLGTGGLLSGAAGMSLPVTARATDPVLWGMGLAVDDSAGTGQRAIAVQPTSTTVVGFVNGVTGGTVAATNPFTWAVNDHIRVSFFYEAA